MHFWTTHEIEFLINFYDKVPTSKIATELGKTHVAVWKKLKSLNLKLPKEIMSLNKSLSKTGKKSSSWKGGKTVTKKGYIYVLIAPNRRKFEHVLVMEKFLGRDLQKDEAVHHIDENKQNNDIKNLKLMRFGEHSALHNTQRKSRGVQL